MPSSPAGPSAPTPSTVATRPAHPGEAARELAAANRALWLATLGLMTAFMQMPAPAHRLQLARRIARNFETLAQQECFDRGCQASFERLGRRWQARALQLAPRPAPVMNGLLRLLF